MPEIAMMSKIIPAVLSTFLVFLFIDIRNNIFRINGSLPDAKRSHGCRDNPADKFR
jgi:hypothetical protein